VLYREGMPGIFLFMAFCLALIFIVSIRFGAEPIIAAFPDESYGLFLVILFSIFVQILLLLVYEKNHQVPRNILIGTLILFAVGVSVYKFADYPFKFTYLGYAVVVLITFYLIYNAISIRKGTYALIALFGIVAIGFSNLSETAFNRLLPHQQTRIKVTLGMENDPKKAGYNVNQSKIAIGSGGLTGKGFLNGTQTKLKYVPEQDTDFIFCTVGEEHGFIGSVTVLSLFLFLFLRLIYLAERQRSLFSRIYGYCVSCIVFFHLFVNIGMVLGLTPVIGIPLPFFSYGGSSLWGFTILLFIFLRLDASRTEYFG
ncbi:MAG: rod shape-determining protein RodA, partial [Paludibacteraceae bacterium]|nr:rod shape-determining protein RodA [Paludibacteraceae bacterium]